MTTDTQERPKVLTADERAARPWRKYRLLPKAANGLPTGRHMQVDKDGRTRMYPAGSILESQEDLAERDPGKFEVVRDEMPRRPEDVLVPAGYKLVKDDAPAAGSSPQAVPPPAAPAAGKPPLHTRESLQALTVEALRGIAADEEIEVKGHEKDKDWMVKAILGK